jgi:hypothetical protein
MAVVRVQTTTAIEGKEAEFMAFTKELKDLMVAKGLATFLRVSHSGTQNIEVYNITMFEDMKAYGAAQDMMMSDADYQAMYSRSVSDRTGIMLDASEMMEVPGFEFGAQPSGDVVFSTAWNILPASGMGGAFMKSCHQAKVIHEKYGAKVRLWQPMSGRYAGKFLYQLAFQDFSSLGEAMDGWKSEFAEFNRGVPVSATIDSQIVMRGSTLL